MVLKNMFEVKKLCVTWENKLH